MNNKLNNNINSFKIPRPVIIAGKFLQIFSPKLTAKYIANFFSTPLKFKIPERELMFRESAKNELLSIKTINKKVMTYSYGYSKKKVLLVHGWSGRGTQLYHLADKILENQMMVISFDAPAHGLSSGKTTMLNEFIETIIQLDKKFGPFYAVVGHSFGGMSILNAVAFGLKTNKIVIIGTDDSVPEIMKNFINKLELKPVITNQLKKIFQDKNHVNIDDYSSNKAAKKVIEPTLIIHDSEDNYVAVSCAFSIRQNLKNGKLLITNGLGHHKIFKNKEIINRIINFIK